MPRRRGWRGLGLAAGLALIAMGCEGTGAPRAELASMQGAETGGVERPAAHAAQLPLSPAAGMEGKGKAKLNAGPPPAAPEARAAFEQTLSLIESHYVEEGIDPDRLYTAAMRGVMSELIQMPGHEVNALLSPEELARLLEGTKGEIVGVGVAIERVGGMLVVREAIEGGPAAAAGLLAGDRVLAVDGQRVESRPLVEVVRQIRGEVGQSVELYVQRDTEEWTVAIERAPIAVASVESATLEPGLGYLRIRGFSEPTAAEVGLELERLRGEGMRGLVLDLRDCPGGLLEAAIEVAELFLAPGREIVTIRGRKGVDARVAARDDADDALPLVVLIGPGTASGAEILSGALQESGRAVVVGEPSLGKGTVEAIHELDNGWALKLSSARFFSPGDVPRQGNAVQPDFVVPGTPGAKLPQVEALAATPDAQTHAAMRLLELSAK